HGHAVVPTSGLRGHEAVLHVLTPLFNWAPARIAEAAAAALVDLEDFALVVLVEALGVDVDDTPLLPQAQAARRPREPALDAERRRLGAVAAAEVRRGDVVGIHAPAVDGAHAAAPLPWAGAVRPELVLQHRVWIHELIQLGIRRAQAAGADHRAQ